MRPWLPLAVCLLIAGSSQARPSLVCRVTARLPYSAAIGPGGMSTRVFTQTALLLEEHLSGTAQVRRWTVIADTPGQIVAVDAPAATTLTIDRPGLRFAESGIETQIRGYCWDNDLP